MHSPIPPVSGSLISASAGTGKTYRLSVRFIALLALGIPPACMIALTFTRKAAGEFHDRILRELSHAAASPKAAEDLAKAIRSAWKGEEGMPPLCPQAEETQHPLTQERFLELLKLMIDSSARLNLSTLDSFFNKLVMSNRLELGLSQIKLVSNEEEEDARKEALQALFAWIAEQDNETVESFLAVVMGSQKQMNRDIISAVQELLQANRELFLAHPQEDFWGKAQAFGLRDCSTLAPLSSDYYDRAETEMQELLLSADAPARLAGNLSGLCNKMRNSYFGGFSTLEKALVGDRSKGNAALQKALALAERLIQDSKNELLRRAQCRCRAVYQVLRQFEQFYRLGMQERGVMGFSDITRLLPPMLEKDGIATQLAYRLDSSLKHWMLDEFQDSSDLQWEALRRLVEEIAYEEANAPDHCATRSLFVVGDEKQSIYGWRGGSPQIFRDLQEKEPWKLALQRAVMTKSYRSAPIIMDFANRVFQFSGALQHSSARQKMQGCVELRCYAKAKNTEEEGGKPKWEAMGAVLDSLHFPEKEMSISILFRSKKPMYDFFQWLKEKRPELPVQIAAERRPATEAPAGQSLLAFFRWLAHPKDSYSQAVAYNSPLAPYLQETGSGIEDWRKALELGGYGQLVRRMADYLKAQEGLLSECQVQCLELWCREATAYDITGGTLDDWILHMERLSNKDNPPKDFIQLMTIHNSKGLEFDAVLYAPDCGSHRFYDHGKNLHELLAYDAAGDVCGLMLNPGDSGIRKLWPGIAAAAERWAEQQREEGRNLLYVALTRAAHANYIFLEEGCKAGEGLRCDLDYILPAFGIGEAEGDICFKSEEHPPVTDWYMSLSPRRSADAKEEDSAPALLPPTPRRPRRSPSAAADETYDTEQGGNKEADGEEALRFAQYRESSLRFGTEMHACMEEIQDAAAPLPAWAAAPQSEAQKAAAAALRQPEIRRLLSLKAGERVYNEQSLEAINQGNWVSAIIDRLVLREDGSALIIDYKSNRERSGLKAHYAPQMRAYRRLVAQALQLDPARIHVCLVGINLHAPAEILSYENNELD